MDKAKLLTQLECRSINTPNWFRRTPLTMLANREIYGPLDLFRFGGTANIDFLNLSGQTALEIALQRKNRKLVRLLRALGEKTYFRPPI